MNKLVEKIEGQRNNMDGLSIEEIDAYIIGLNTAINIFKSEFAERDKPDCEGVWIKKTTYLYKGEESIVYSLWEIRHDGVESWARSTLDFEDTWVDLSKFPESKWIKAIVPTKDVE